MTEKNPKDMFVEQEGKIGSSLRVDYDQDLLDQLVEEDSWIEFTRPADNGTIQHYLMPPYSSVIRNINWNE
jgi:hypothetical protein